MNDNGFLFNLERAQAGPVDEEALARKVAARAVRVLIFVLSTTYPHCPPHAYKYQFDFCAFHTIS